MEDSLQEMYLTNEEQVREIEVGKRLDMGGNAVQGGDSVMFYGWFTCCLAVARQMI